MATLAATLDRMNEMSTEFMDAAEFLDWLEPGQKADLIDGKICMHSPVSLNHANLLNFVDRLLGQYIDDKNLGVLYREVVAVKLGNRDVFLPDLCFFTPEQAPFLKPSHIECAPKLAVEVLSPSSITRDAQDKFLAYEAGGVMEYWILDPEKHNHRFFRLREGIYKSFDSMRSEIIASEAVPGFFLRREWINSIPLPRIKDCLAEVLTPRA